MKTLTSASSDIETTAFFSPENALSSVTFSAAC
jgi:hypothetical protein